MSGLGRCCLPGTQREGGVLRSEGWLQGTLHTVMEEGDVTDMYTWLERLAKNPYTDDELRPVVPGEPLLDVPRSALI